MEEASQREPKGFRETARRQLGARQVDEASKQDEARIGEERRQEWRGRSVKLCVYVGEEEEIERERNEGENEVTRAYISKHV